MYVCICNSVTDNQIRDAVSNGASSYEDLQSNLGVATCCGRCGDCAKRIFNQAQCQQVCFTRQPQVA